MHTSLTILLMAALLIAQAPAGDEQPAAFYPTVIPGPIDQEWHFREQMRVWENLSSLRPGFDKPQTWAECLENSPFRRSLGLDLKPLRAQPCTIREALPWHEVLSHFAGATGQVWRLRGSHIEFLPAPLAEKLSRTLDGTMAPRGTSDEVLAWFATSSSLRIHQHASLDHSDDVHLRFAPRSGTVEEWLVGIGYALHAAILIQPTGDVVIYLQPDFKAAPLIPVVAAEPQSLTHYVGPPTALDRPVSFRFEQTSLSESIRNLGSELGFPIEIEDALLRETNAKFSIFVDKMKIRDALDLIRALGLGDLPNRVEVLNDRVRIVADVTAVSQ